MSTTSGTATGSSATPTGQSRKSDVDEVLRMLTGWAFEFGPNNVSHIYRSQPFRPYVDGEVAGEIVFR